MRKLFGTALLHAADTLQHSTAAACGRSPAARSATPPELVSLEVELHTLTVRAIPTSRDCAYPWPQRDLVFVEVESENVVGDRRLRSLSRRAASPAVVR